MASFKKYPWYIQVLIALGGLFLMYFVTFIAAVVNMLLQNSSSQ